MSNPFEIQMNLYIRTTGRHSGQTRPVHLWFAYADGLVYLLSLVYKDGSTTHWCRNLRTNPHCLLDVCDERFQAELVSAEPNDALEQRIRDMFRTRYGKRPYEQWFGDDPMLPVVVRVRDEEPPSAAVNPYAELKDHPTV